MSESHHKNGGNKGNARGDTYRPESEFGMATLFQIPSTNRESHKSTHDQQRINRMEIARDGGGIKRCSNKVSQNRLSSISGKLCACRSLHPGIGDNDPKCGKAGAKPNQPSGGKVELLTNFFAAKQKNA